MGQVLPEEIGEAVDHVVGLVEELALLLELLAEVENRLQLGPRVHHLVGAHRFEENGQLAHRCVGIGDQGSGLFPLFLGSRRVLAVSSGVAAPCFVQQQHEEIALCEPFVDH